MQKTLRVRRRLFNLATTVSLALFVATVALWVRSLSRYESISYGSWNGSSRRSTLVEMMWGDGRIAFSYTFIDVASGQAASPQIGWGHDVQPYMSFNPYDDLSDTFNWWLCAKESSVANPALGSGFSRMIGVRLWPMMLLSAILPVMWARRKLRQRGAGRCPTCGYDLRATPDRCPECGTVSTVNAKTAA